MNTHGMTDKSTGIMRQSILHDIQQAKAAHPGISSISRLQEAVTGFYNDAAALDAELAAINADSDLSSEGKNKKRAAAVDAWRERSSRAATEVERITKEVTASAGSTEIPVPAADPVLLETKLGNARIDARMLLDHIEPSKLPDHMKTLVEHNADPIVSYLLIATEWGTNYLRSRLPADASLRGSLHGPNRTHGALVYWDTLRRDLTPHLLDEAGRKAWSAQKTLQPLARAPQYVHATRFFFLKDRGLNP